MELSIIEPRWSGPVIVAAPGPSLTSKVANACRDYPVIAVQDAYKLLPFAEVLYGCDDAWWTVHKGCPDFQGEKWASHGDEQFNDKTAAQRRYGLKLIQGKRCDGFCPHPDTIHYGSNSGFQAVNLAMHLSFRPATIVLVGFNMKRVAGQSHFFGEHPQPLQPPQFPKFIEHFEKAARKLPPDVEILNATEASALTCFPFAVLESMLSEQSVSAAAAGG